MMSVLAEVAGNIIIGCVFAVALRWFSDMCHRHANTLQRQLDHVTRSRGRVDGDS
jgi:hypothetical protein